MDYRKEVPYDAFGDHAPIEGDYISREAVLGCLYKTMESYHVKRNIMDIPAADVRPVVRARLARYEDTGLEPEEIMADMPDITAIEAELDRYKCAEAEGRLLVLPCRVGTHLWKVTHPYKAEPKVTEFVVKNIRTAGKKHRMQIEVQAVNVPATNWMEPSKFYRTREEAEAALRGLRAKEREQQK